MRSSRSWLGSFVAALIVILFGVQDASAKVASWPDWVGGKRNLKIYVPPNSSQAFKDAVQAAIDAWNADNAGWTLTPTSSEREADVDVRSESCGGHHGLSTPTVSGGGLFSRGSLTHVKVQINPSLSGNRLQSVIMHELGHCMRMAHTSVGDILDPYATNDPTTPSAKDKSEVLASDKDPDCPLLASVYLLRGDDDQTVYLTPAPWSDISFDGLEGVTIQSLTGLDFSASVVSWGLDSIRLSVDVSLSAAHNEVYYATLDYGLAGTESYTGLLWIADTPIGMNVLPHAVAGDDIQVYENEAVVLDSSQSYHDSSGLTAEMSAYWLIDIENSDDDLCVLDGYAELEDLPVGEHAARLTVTDYYGRESSDTITITVTEP